MIPLCCEKIQKYKTLKECDCEDVRTPARPPGLCTALVADTRAARCGAQGCPKCRIIYELDVTCTSDTTMDVTTEHLDLRTHDGGEDRDDDTVQPVSVARNSEEHSQHPFNNAVLLVAAQGIQSFFPVPPTPSFDVPTGQRLHSPSRPSIDAG